MLSAAFPRRRLPPVQAELLGGGGGSWSTRFRVAPQLQTQWCWAAVSSSVALHFDANSQWSQCMVAGAEMGSACCAHGDSTICNQPHYLDAALTRVGHLRAATQGYMLPPAVVAELQLDRPVAIRVGWSMGGGHFLTIVGLAAQPNDTILQLSDPIFGASSIQGSALINGGYQSGGGSWTHSYVVQP